MYKIGSHSFRSIRLLCLCAVAWADAAALAAGDAAAADAAARHRHERAVCTSGQSNQDRATCLREASAAHAQMRKNGMHEPDMAFEQNAQKRCQALPDDDRSACLARMQGHGSTSGSVSGGGIYRELVTPEAATPTVVKPGANSSSTLPK
jgi:hypothetical protein